MSQYAYEEKYLNKTCPHCGGNILIINNILEVCEKCGYTPPSSNTVTMNNKIIADNQKEGVSFGAYGWICPKCGNTTIVKGFLRWSIIPHTFNIWRWVKCSHCGKRSWVRKMKEQ